VDEAGVVLAGVAHLDAEDYSSWLLAAVGRVLAEAGRRLSEVTLYAAAAGPGSFTGIRVGLTTVKAWSEVSGVKIAAVSRLEALAATARDGREIAPRMVAACFDAQRGEVYGAIYRSEGGNLRRMGDEAVVAPGALIDRAARESRGEAVAWVCLDRGALFGEACWAEREALGEVIEVADPVLAPAIARVAKRLAAEGKLTDALGIDAHYILRPHAEVQWKGYVKPSV
jgi:tRNA threonylcarbamoyladenosine biosynthesis protein TsaB